MKEYDVSVLFNKGYVLNMPKKLVQNDYNLIKLNLTFDIDGRVVFKLLYPDREKFIVDEVEDNSIVFKEGYLSQEGTYLIEFAIYDETGRLTNNAISDIEVRKELVSTNEIVEADDRVPILDGLINEINEAMSRVENIQPGSGDSEQVISESNRLKSHSWSVIGDSISHDNLYVTKQYWDFLKDRVGGMIIHNYGVSGRRITEMATNYTNVNYSDIITVFGGVNDWGLTNPTPIGTINDTDTSSFYGALNILCEGLLTTFPKSLILFITPLGNNGFNSGSFVYTNENILGLTIYDYADAIIKTCAKYKIPVIDACRNSKLNPYIGNLKSLYFVDGLHLNSLGHEVLSYMIESEILKYYIPTIDEEPAITYSITNNLTNCSTNNSNNIVEENSAYQATITASDGYTIDNVIITMGNVDITSSVYSNGVINISSVTGNIVITANAIESSSSETNYINNLLGKTITITNAEFPNLHAFVDFVVEDVSCLIDDSVEFEAHISDISGFSEAYPTISIEESSNLPPISINSTVIVQVNNCNLSDGVFTMSGIAKTNHTKKYLHFAMPLKMTSVSDLPYSFKLDDISIKINGNEISDKIVICTGIFGNDVITISDN